MFTTIHYSHIYSLERVWFSNSATAQCDVLRFLRANEPLPNSMFVINDTPVETVFSDLRGYDDILKAASKTVKNEVTRCKKEDVQVSMYDSRALSSNPSVLDCFFDVYKAMAQSANNQELLKAYNPKLIKDYIDSEHLYVSCAIKEDCSVYHIYVAGANETVLLFSASNFRGEDRELRNLCGRMNKLLHYMDMTYFRDNGYELYDWGNISSSSSPNGIDRFKMSFGGTINTVYNSYKGNTLWGKFLVLIYKVKVVIQKRIL